MKKIKLIELYISNEEDGYNYNNYGSIIELSSFVTDWDEISDEDYDLLRTWINDTQGKQGNRIAMLEQVKVQNIADYTEKARQHIAAKEELAAKRHEETRKWREREAMRIKKIEEKRLAKEKAIYEKLRPKFENVS